MAEAMLNDEAIRRGHPIRALSAGTMGGNALNPVAVQAMAEIGIDMSGQKPKLLIQSMADSADRIITMGCGVDAEACPAKFFVTEDWGLDDPSGQSVERVREIRDQIKEKVEQLLTQS